MSERVKAELTAPHALHPFHPAYQEAQLKAEEGHTWPSEKRKKKTPEQGATVLLITCGEPRKMR